MERFYKHTGIPWVRLIKLKQELIVKKYSPDVAKATAVSAAAVLHRTAEFI